MSGGKQYVSVTYFPHRSVWANAAVVDRDQIGELDTFGNPYKQRMDSIEFAMEVNGVRVERSEMELLPGVTSVWTIRAL